jgi:hypothetical protein
MSLSLSLLLLPLSLSLTHTCRRSRASPRTTSHTHTCFCLRGEHVLHLELPHTHTCFCLCGDHMLHLELPHPSRMPKFLGSPQTLPHRSTMSSKFLTWPKGSCHRRARQRRGWDCNQVWFRGFNLLFPLASFFPWL